MGFVKSVWRIKIYRKGLIIAIDQKHGHENQTRGLWYMPVSAV